MNLKATQRGHSGKVPELGDLDPVGQTRIERMGAPPSPHNLREHLAVRLDENAVPAALQLEEEAVGKELAVEAARLHVEALPLRSQQAIDVSGLTDLTEVGAYLAMECKLYQKKVCKHHFN